ncbi:hypothetical protein [Micromonospora echinofusca]|uniref:MYXO-CTERM domain-containing protein n=1 Tax=Micromonospora echinofusca TaxID=47858 RepID=A0ABS3VWU8_MICEH|nr:hypothetical protein [Micromonospora echinofusca]MBO4208848.1 hypothetical protein [Micromonospora echinofusca]
MAKKFLGKLVVGAALGGAALLVSAPGIALADQAPAPHKWGKIYTEPATVHPGQRIEIVQVCSEEQAHPKAWSKVTGEVKLHPVTHDKGEPGGQPGGMPGGEHKGGRPGGETGGEHKGGQPGGETGGEHKGGKGGSDTGPEHKKFVYAGEAQVDRHARPGTYELKGSCAEGEVVVAPRGHVEGGDGGATTSTGMAAGGIGLVAAAALGSMLVLRRRQANGTLA